MRRIVVLVGACLALAGCGDDGKSSQSNGATAGSPQQTVSISETEFSLSPSTVNVGRAGTIAFKVTNNGKVTHALEIEGNGVEDKTASIAPGQSATLTVQLSKPGSYEMYCPIDSHRGKGMEGGIRVAGSSGAGADTRGSTTTDEGMTTEGTTTEGTTTSGGYGY
jgi:uncharacterized cupredoxin-like copper-binding protein